MDYHPITIQITEILSKNNYWFETFEHEPVFSSDGNQRLSGTGSSVNIRHYRYIKTEYPYLTSFINWSIKQV